MVMVISGIPRSRCGRYTTGSLPANGELEHINERRRMTKLVFQNVSMWLTHDTNTLLYNHKLWVNRSMEDSCLGTNEPKVTNCRLDVSNVMLGTTIGVADRVSLYLFILRIGVRTMRFRREYALPFEVVDALTDRGPSPILCEPDQPRISWLRTFLICPSNGNVIRRGTEGLGGKGDQSLGTFWTLLQQSSRWTFCKGRPAVCEFRCRCSGKNRTMPTRSRVLVCSSSKFNTNQRRLGTFLTLSSYCIVFHQTSGQTCLLWGSNCGLFRPHFG